MILPNAKCIIGFGFAVPKAIYKAMANGNHQYTYTTLGVKYFDEEMVVDTYELISEPVDDGKPAPDVIIDFGRAAKVCGLCEMGLNGKIINKKYGHIMRYCFIIIDVPLECDEPLKEYICDKCGDCINDCPGNAVSASGLDTWQCSVYYKGAHKLNPFMPPEAFECFDDILEILRVRQR